jgi:hypothetical protein
MNLFGFNLKMFGRRQLATHPSLQDVPTDQMGGNDTQSSYAAFDWFQRQMEVEAERRRRYETYYRMDLTDIVTMVADQYADDCTATMPEIGHKVWFDTPSQPIMGALQGLHKSLSLDENAFSLVRQLALYGDDFERTVYARGQGIKAIQWADPRKIQRQEDKYRRIVGFKQEGMRFKQDKNQEISWPWDYVHFRMMGKDRSNCYGTSIFHGAIRGWKQLMMAEDELLFYRLNRRYDRDHHYVDTGTNDEVEGRRILERYMKRFRRQEFGDPNQKQYEFNFRPVSPSDDLFIPVHEGSNTRVERVAGNPMAGEIRDLIYYLDKYFGAVKTPKEMFGFLGDDAQMKVLDLKKKLTSQNIVYARSVQRVQHAFKAGIRELGEIHLDLLDNDPESTQYDYSRPENEFKVKMEPVSYLAEYERLDLLQLRTGVATALLQLPQVDPNINGYELTAYVLKNVLQFSDVEVQSMLQQAQAMPESKESKELGGNDSLQRIGDAVTASKTFAKLDSKHAAILEAALSNKAVLKSIAQTKLLFEHRNVEPGTDGSRRAAFKNKDTPAVLEDVAGPGDQDGWADLAEASRPPEGRPR